MSVSPIYTLTVDAYAFINGAVTNQRVSQFPTLRLEELNSGGGVVNVVVNNNNAESLWRNLPLQSGVRYRLTVVADPTKMIFAQWSSSAENYASRVREISASNTSNLTFNCYFGSQTDTGTIGVLVPSAGSTINLGPQAVSGFVIPPVGVTTQNVEIRFERPDRSLGHTMVQAQTTNNWFFWANTGVQLSNAEFTTVRVRATWSNGVQTGFSSPVVISGGTPPPAPALGSIVASSSTNTATVNDPLVSSNGITFTVTTRDQNGQALGNVPLSYTDNGTNFGTVGSSNASGQFTFVIGFVVGSHQVRFTSGTVQSNIIPITVTLVNNPPAQPTAIVTPMTVAQNGTITINFQGLPTNQGPLRITFPGTPFAFISPIVFTPSSSGTYSTTFSISNAPIGSFSVDLAYDSSGNRVQNYQPPIVTVTAGTPPPTNTVITSITATSNITAVPSETTAVTFSGTISGTGTLSGIGIGIQIDGTNFPGTFATTAGFGSFTGALTFSPGNHTIKFYPTSQPSMQSQAIILSVAGAPPPTGGGITGITATVDRTSVTSETTAFNFQGVVAGTNVSGIPIGITLDGTDFPGAVASTNLTGTFSLQTTLGPGNHQVKFYPISAPAIKSNTLAVSVGGTPPPVGTGDDWQKYGVYIAAAALLLTLGGKK